MNKFLSLLITFMAVAQAAAFMGTQVFTQRPVRGERGRFKQEFTDSWQTILVANPGFGAFFCEHF
jgi:hypothetical protein